MRTTRRSLTIVALLLSAFMAAIEMTVVSTAMPTVIAELGGVQASVGWETRGVATASTLLFRTLGGTLSVGALGAVLAGRAQARSGAARAGHRAVAARPCSAGTGPS